MLIDEEKENIETSRLKVVHFDKEPSKGETREERISRKSGKIVFCLVVLLL